MPNPIHRSSSLADLTTARPLETVPPSAPAAPGNRTNEHLPAPRLNRSASMGSMSGTHAQAEESMPPRGLTHLRAQLPSTLNIDAASEKINAINSLVSKLQNTELFRGITYNTDNSKDVFTALKHMSEDGKGTFPIMWGFRQYHPGEELLAQEINTLKTFAGMFREGLGELGIEARTPVILADRHAEHNGVPADGPEGYQPYYEKVKAEAEKLGLPTAWLSDIFDKLNTSSHKIAERGEQLIRKRDKDLDPVLENPKAAQSNPAAQRLLMLANTPGTKEHRLKVIPTTLTDKEYFALKGQRRKMVERYPDTHRELLKASSRVREAAYGKAGVEYAQFRAGEGQLLLPNLNKYFETRGVLPVHVAEPEAAKIGVRGLNIFSKDKHGHNVANIPWKGEEIVEKEQQKKQGRPQPSGKTGRSE